MSPNHRTLVLCSCLVLVAVLAAGCMITPATTPPVPAGVKKFNSTAEIEQYLEESAARVPRDSTFSTLVPTMAAGGISNARSPGERAQALPSLHQPFQVVPGTRRPMSRSQASMSPIS